jgi:hypothetical protein
MMLRKLCVAAFMAILPTVGLAQTVTLDDVYRECQRHARAENSATVPAGQPGSYQLGYESCTKIGVAWRALSESQRQMQAQQSLHAGGPAAIDQFVQSNNLGQ